MIVTTYATAKSDAGSDPGSLPSAKCDSGLAKSDPGINWMEYVGTGHGPPIPVCNYAKSGVSDVRYEVVQGTDPLEVKCSPSAAPRRSTRARRTPPRKRLCIPTG